MCGGGEDDSGVYARVWEWGLGVAPGRGLYWEWAIGGEEGHGRAGGGEPARHATCLRCAIIPPPCPFPIPETIL